MCKPKIKVTRRDFMKHMAAGVGAIALGQLNSKTRIGPRDAFAAPGDKRLLVVNFTGGYDNLFIVQPDLGSLAARRPTLFMNSSTVLAGPGNEGFHPALTQFKSLWDGNDLAVCHKVGYANFSRSHQDSQDTFARGVSDRRSTTSSGFLNRLGAVNFSNNFSLIDFTGGYLGVERGPFNPTIVRRLQDFGYDKNTNTDRFVRETAFAINEQYAMKNGKALAVGDALDLAANAEQLIQDAIADHSFDTDYPNSGIGRQFRDVEIAFAELDTRIAYTEIGGVDTHGGQASRMQSILGSFDNALEVFIQNMQSLGMWNDVIILVISEFSRTIDENGNQGTDHGGATDCYVMGPSVNGGLFGGAYTNADFASNVRFLNTSLNMLDVYRPIVSAMGFNPTSVFESYSGAQNLNLF